MSRTVRRKNEPLPWWVTKKLEWVEDTFLEWVPKEGSELVKDIAVHRSDNGYVGNSSGYGPGRWFRWNQQKCYRNKCNKELSKWKKNEDYEIQIQQRPYLPYWD